MAPDSDSSLLVECLNKFQTHNFDANWLHTTWNGDHSQLDYLPPEYEEIHQDTDWSNVFRETSAAVRDFVVRTRPNNENAGKDKSEDEEEDDTQTFWFSLVENGISFKGIVIVTGCFMERGSGRTAAFKDCEIALQAASLYLCFVCLPGSKAFRLFHSVLYSKAVELFSVVKRFGNCKSTAATSGKRKRAENKSTFPRKSRPTNRRRSDSSDRGGENEAGVEESTSDTEGEDFALTNQEIKLLIRSLRQLLLDLKLFLDLYALKSDAQSVEQTARHLCLFFSLEGNVKTDDWNSLLPGVRACLLTLCTPCHGVVETSVAVILRNASSSVLNCGSRSAIAFVGQLIDGVPDGRALPGLHMLIQRLCLKVPERADARGRVASVVLALLDKAPAEAFLNLTRWFLVFMRNGKVNFRIFALEMVALVLGRSPLERPLAGVPAEPLRKLADGCLVAMLQRCSDSAATVRSKALTVFASCVVTGNSLAQMSVTRVFLPGSATPIATDVTARKGSVASDKLSPLAPPIMQSSQSSGTDTSNNPPGRNFPNFDTTTEESESDGSGDKSGDPVSEAQRVRLTNVMGTLPNSKFIMELMRDRATDKKVHVRKAAIQVLQKGMELAIDCLTLENIDALQYRCLDTSILVKKQSMQALTTLLLTYPNMNVIHQAWMNGVLPSIMDPENSVQEKCAEMVDEVLLKHIAAHPQSKSRFHSMFWTIMNEVAGKESHHDKAWRYIKRAMSVMAASGKLRKNLVNLLQSHIDTENDVAAWLLLSGLASTVDIKNPDFAFEYWDAHQDELNKRSKSLSSVLQVMAATCKKLDQARTKKYFDNLSSLLEELSCNYKMISALVEAIAKLCKALEDKKFNPKIHKVYGSVFKKCDHYLSSVFLNEGNKAENIDEDTVIIHLAAGTEVAMVCPKLSSERISIVLKCILASKCSADEAAIKLSKRLVKFNTGVLSQRLKNYAIVAIGKLSLQKESLAKECTPALGLMLETSTNRAARNNIVVVLVDLCVRYTTMVDPYFPSVTACLKDPSFMVRMHTLNLLTHLLQEDYIKWRGSLFFCFITAVIDPSKAIREFTKHAIVHILTKRHPTMLFQHFVECLFFFNAYQDHEAYNKIAQSEKEAKLFAMEGERNMAMRMLLYRFMLENMADEHRFKITAKLCNDILGGVLNNTIKLKRANGDPCTKGHTLVKDTLAILSCDEIKLATLRSSPQEELEESDVAAAVVATVKKTIITQMVKRNVIENIMPIIIGLKHKLEKLLSPLSKDLMIYLKELTKDFKAEVKEILSEDKQLAAEVEYDLKKLEQQQAEEQRRAKRAETERRVSDSEKQTAENANPIVIGRSAAPPMSSEIVTDVPDLKKLEQQQTEEQRRAKRADTGRRVSDSEKQTAANTNQIVFGRSAAPPMSSEIATDVPEASNENGNGMPAPAAPPPDRKVPMSQTASNFPETRTRLVARRSSRARSVADDVGPNQPAVQEHKVAVSEIAPDPPPGGTSENAKRAPDPPPGGTSESAKRVLDPPPGGTSENAKRAPDPASRNSISAPKPSPGSAAPNTSSRRPIRSARRNGRSRIDAELSKSALDATLQPVVQVERLESSVLDATLQPVVQVQRLDSSALDATLQPVVQVQRLDSSVLQNGSVTVMNDSKVPFYSERMAETVVNPPTSQILGTKPNASTGIAGIPVLRISRVDDPVVPETVLGAPKTEPLSPCREVLSTPTNQTLHRQLMRAISTPCGVITDITFGTVPGPLSPIVEPHRQRLLLHLATPDKAPSQRQWNVVPPPKPVLLPAVSEDEEEESGSR